MKKIVTNNLFLIILSSILTGLSMMPLHIGFIAWFSLIPFLYIIFKQTSFKKIILYSFIWGLVYHSTVIFWLSSNIGTSTVIAIISMIASVLILSINTIMISSIWYYVKIKFPLYKFIIFPISWVVVEFIRSYGFLGFPWISIANSQLEYLLLIQNNMQNLLFYQLNSDQ